jgi:hypothetical protein
MCDVWRVTCDVRGVMHFFRRNTHRHSHQWHAETRTRGVDLWRVMCDVCRVMRVVCFVMCDVWCVTCDVWRVMCDVWRVMCDVWLQLQSWSGGGDVVASGGLEDGGSGGEGCCVTYVMCDVWYLMCNFLCVTCGVWCVICDVCDMRFVVCDVCDMRHYLQVGINLPQTKRNSAFKPSTTKAGPLFMFFSELEFDMVLIEFNLLLMFWCFWYLIILLLLLRWQLCIAMLTSQITPHTSHLTPHTSHLTPHTSHLTPHTSHLTPHILPLCCKSTDTQPLLTNLLPTTKVPPCIATKITTINLFYYFNILSNWSSSSSSSSQPYTTLSPTWSCSKNRWSNWKGSL